MKKKGYAINMHEGNFDEFLRVIDNVVGEDNRSVTDWDWDNEGNVTRYQITLRASKKQFRKIKTILNLDKVYM